MLFVERAQAAKPHLGLDEANAGAVAEVCWRLDGPPLAIKLAAARIKLLPPRAMLERLHRHLEGLVGGRVTRRGATQDAEGDHRPTSSFLFYVPPSGKIRTPNTWF